MRRTTRLKRQEPGCDQTQILSWTFLEVPANIDYLRIIISAEFVDSLKGFLLPAIRGPASSFHNFGGKRSKRERG
jgi:hypothetical protein